MDIGKFIALALMAVLAALVVGEFGHHQPNFSPNMEPTNVSSSGAVPEIAFVVFPQKVGDTQVLVLDFSGTYNKYPTGKVVNWVSGDVSTTIRHKIKPGEDTSGKITVAMYGDTYVQDGVIAMPYKADPDFILSNAYDVKMYNAEGRLVGSTGGPLPLLFYPIDGISPGTILSFKVMVTNGSTTTQKVSHTNIRVP